MINWPLFILTSVENGSRPIGYIIFPVDEEIATDLFNMVSIDSNVTSIDILLQTPFFIVTSINKTMKSVDKMMKKIRKLGLSAV